MNSPAADKLLEEMLDTRQLGDERSDRAVTELVRRAYLGPDGPLTRIVSRLKHGYSVLAYVPGNCMDAIAAILKEELRQKYDWTDYLEHPEDTDTLEDVWRRAPSLVARIRDWLKQSGTKAPAAVFHNLDFLNDGHGGMLTHPSALTALSGLVAGSRRGIVVGLSDRDEPPVPAAVSRAFTEQIRIDEIPHENFHRLIPRAVADKLQAWQVLSEGTIWLLASRLRWTDPVRVLGILREAHPNVASLEGLFLKIVEITKTISFESAASIYSGGKPVGVSHEILAMLNDGLIQPYQQWKRFRGDRKQYCHTIDKLPPGGILFGPPGTGKTHLARWIAGDIGLPVRVVSGGELRAAGWGDAERNVNRLFRELRRSAPCVLVLDDAEDLLGNRAELRGGLASAETAVVDEFLRQLSGIYGPLEGVLVILTTNRFDAVDPAVRGRLALHVRVPYPVGEVQIGEIVQRIGRAYNYDVTEEVCRALVARFSAPIGSNPGAAETADKNYFSQREMQQAMRMLDSWTGEPGARYRPTLDDVARITAYYDKFS